MRAVQATEQQEPVDIRSLMSIPEAARRLGCNRVTVWRWAASGEIPSVRMGHLVLVPRAEIARRLGVEAEEL